MAARKKAMPKWTKAPEALVALFGRAVQEVLETETQKMFGYPAAFLRGQMFTGLFQSNMILRLSTSDRQEFLGEFKAVPFERMPGRVMREYMVVPEAVLSSPRLLSSWVRKAHEYAASLPDQGAQSETRRDTPTERMKSG
jgi:TfoX/Sxy family transcriptional regulator of competence genes